MKRSKSLTTPDLVVLSLLCERPMHGYEVNAELERRDVRDWAAVSRPQIYYSLRKLEESGLLTATEEPDASLGPPRRRLAPTSAAKRALAEALSAERWSTHRDRPRFSTWLALSHDVPKGTARKLIRRRRRFLEAELDRERLTLKAIVAETGSRRSSAALMVRLVIQQFRTELAWLDEVEEALGERTRGGGSV